jgi:hypothetical protein
LLQDLDQIAHISRHAIARTVQMPEEAVAVEQGPPREGEPIRERVPAPYSSGAPLRVPHRDAYPGEPAHEPVDAFKLFNQFSQYVQPDAPSSSAVDVSSADAYTIWRKFVTGYISFAGTVPENQGGITLPVFKDFRCKYIQFREHHNQFVNCRGDHIVYVQADRPLQCMPGRRSAVGYFDVTCIKPKVDANIMIGLAPYRIHKLLDEKNNIILGKEVTSIAYHVDDGHIHAHSHTKGSYDTRVLVRSEPPEHLVIGCGIVYDSGKVFFTRNGVLLDPFPVYPSDMSCVPTIGTWNKGDEVQVNFGRTKFVYKIGRLSADPEKFVGPQEHE